MRCDKRDEEEKRWDAVHLEMVSGLFTTPSDIDFVAKESISISDLYL